ncbi:hypothetical protein TTHERM_001068139 (macronuclear) [Tetrahymena thermophila SB210]|uniref:Uncharacterized protein n=1 Tax=Tetrahymena thermophila (strain SB210) TaxID=312017 RepID=W7X5V1_TETTS|nr:hypothetical protein TTHERM_001068139 [Tetrahymena thermophila SB210]EWS72777.1 hypothetical protein TTHERM_001068139 [Tetrahymena thermophila SB210]|eukprot:XP_012654689.1 hypothetical protein TTHERM_001068139 [Tetrahymena thermophila SB210]
MGNICFKDKNLKALPDFSESKKPLDEGKKQNSNQNVNNSSSSESQIVEKIVFNSKIQSLIHINQNIQSLNHNSRSSSYLSVLDNDADLSIQEINYQSQNKLTQKQKSKQGNLNQCLKTALNPQIYIPCLIIPDSQIRESVEAPIKFC